MSAAAIYDDQGLLNESQESMVVKKCKRKCGKTTQPQAGKKRRPKSLVIGNGKKACRQLPNKENTSTNLNGEENDSNHIETAPEMKSSQESSGLSSLTRAFGDVEMKTPTLKTKKAIKSGSKSKKSSLKKDKSAREPKIIRKLNKDDCKKEARQLFKWLISPILPKQFFGEYWEKEHLLIQRKNRTYNDGWFSTEKLKEILANNPVQFGTHLDLTSYQDGKRETHNQPGRAYPAIVWKHYENGGSVRMLSPQIYSEPMWRLLNTLQDYFKCLMGANVYLTPPGTQGFAPHYDDIEAFLIQLEGRKKWRLYKPRSPEETLPRFSSKNFDQSEIGDVILDVVLEAGDMLYFPRGTIHQGICLEDEHSLHVTVSTYQLSSWTDLLEKYLPRALSLASARDIRFRQGLPISTLDHLGLAHSHSSNSSRRGVLKKISELVGILADCPEAADGAVDDLASRLLHDSLPPHPSRCSAPFLASPTPESRVRLATPYCARLVAGDGIVRICHSTSNGRTYREIGEQHLDYDKEFEPALAILMNSYPEWVTVRSLPLEPDQGLELVEELLEMQILECASELATVQ